MSDNQAAAASEAVTENRIYRQDNVSFQTTCKYTITNQKQIQRLVRIKDEALQKQSNPSDPLRFDPKDLAFIGMLCSDGTLDLSKRGITVRAREDGILVAFDLEKDGIATNPKEFGIQSVIHLVPYNEKIANVFHFQIPIATKNVNSNVKQILDRECPKWQQYRSRPRENVHRFLSNKINGRSAFIRSRKNFNHASSAQGWNNEEGGSVECINFEASPEDILGVVEGLKRDGLAEYFNSEEQKIVVKKVDRQLGEESSSDARDDKLWLKLDFEQKDIHSNLLASVGLYTVILDQQKRDPDSKNVYLHGIRKFASQICQGMVDIAPKTDFPMALSGLYDNEEDARDVICSMNLITNRNFTEDSKFGQVASMFNITYQPASGNKKQMYSAHTRFNGNLMIRDMEECHVGRFQASGFPREEVIDMYLASTAALKYKEEKGLQGVAVLNSIGNNEFREDMLEALGLEALKEKNIKDDPLSIEYKDMLALICKQEESVVFATLDGKIFAVYCKRHLVKPKEKTVIIGCVPKQCCKNPSPVNHVANALARLCFICAACRHCEGLRPYERTLRALWLNTECERPEFNKNVHDLAWLSACAKESTNSFHWSVMPYS